MKKIYPIIPHKIEPWFTTFTGKKIYPTKLQIEDIDIIDIAHSLSMLCRFNGHCKFFYSVAQHSSLVVKLCKKYKREALMHDATETYIGDIIKPVKILFSNIEEIEDNIYKIIAKKFNLIYPLPKEVKQADYLALLIEGPQVLPSTKHWDFLPNNLPKIPIYPISSATAKAQFLIKYEELFKHEV